MNIPLLAKTKVVNDKQHIEIWRNSKCELVKAPFLPYFYSPRKLNLSREQLVYKTLLSNLKEQQLYKYSFDNVKQVPQNRESDSIEADIVFTDRILIDTPDFFTQFPNTDKLKVLHFDIETDSDGVFPTPENNAIIGIGAKCGKKKALYIAQDYNDDTEIIHKFFDFIKRTDPDIFSGYNSESFDIPYILKRMEMQHIPTDLWSRDNTKPSFYKNNIEFGGRVSFDIYNQVLRDQTIFGIKNRRMKTVAKWLGYENAIEIEMNDMRNLVNTDTLKEYLKSDVLVTEFLYNVYSKNVLMLADMLHVPLNIMINSTASFIPRITHGRAFQKLGIVSDKNNEERYSEHIDKKQGALVDTFYPGVYRNGVYKVDFASQYPNIVRTFNISPETTRIIEYKTYTGKYSLEYGLFTIPDYQVYHDIVIEVDMSKHGFLADFMDKILKERFEIKRKMKKLDKNSTEYQVLYTRQNSLKVLINTQTGYEGNKFSRFGSMACYVLITGMGRYYLNLVMKYLKSKGIKVISVDTDGIYTSVSVDIQELNDYLDDFTEKTFGLKNYLHMDIEKYEKAFFRKTKGKHYILQDNGRLFFHGASFKGSNLPRFFDDLIQKVAWDMLNGKPSRKNINIKNYAIDDIKQSVKVRDISEYKSKSSLSYQLIQQAKKLNIEGEQLYYVKTKKGYELVIPNKKYDIDWKYYEQIAEKVFERLEIQDDRQMRLC